MVSTKREHTPNNCNYGNDHCRLIEFVELLIYVYSCSQINTSITSGPFHRLYVFCILCSVSLFPTLYQLTIQSRTLSSWIPHRSLSHFLHIYTYTLTSIKAIQMKCVSYRNRNEASSSSPFMQTASLMIQQISFLQTLMLYLLMTLIPTEEKEKRICVYMSHFSTHSYRIHMVYTFSIHIVALAFIHLSHSIELSSR